MSDRTLDDPRLVELFHQASECDESDREIILSKLMSSDPAAARTLARLLEAERSSSDFGSLLVRNYSARALFETLAAQSLPGDSMSAPEHPTRIGEFEILGVLGEGGMATVYLAEDDRGHEVALKVIRCGFVTRSLIRRLEREAEIMRRLDHCGIARILATGTATLRGLDQPFLVMERIRGTTLRRYFDERDVSIKGRVRLLARICDAVGYAHGRGVVHRDIKPTNILVTDDGQPKVLDFGVARAVIDSRTASTQLTRTGQLLGTIRYMSPEHFSADRELVDSRSDVYSIGVMAYELLCRRPPYDLSGRMLHEAARIVSHELPPPLSLFDRGLRGELQHVVHKAIEKRPGRRYPTAAEIGEDFERFADSRPVKARPPGFTTRAANFATRNRPVVLILSILFLVGIAATVIAFLESERSAQLLSLADSKRVADYRAATEPYLAWPQQDERLEAIDAWLKNVRAVSSNAVDHRRRIRELESTGLVEEEAKWQHAVLTSLLEDLDSLTAPGNGLQSKLEARVRVGRENTEHWARALASISDREECPLYGGLRFAPIDGLIPLSRNARSELWEFLAPFPDARPYREADGSIPRPRDHGIVLVLLPGGTFTMGSPFDGKLGQGEFPAHTVELDPFFLAKYETSLADWLAVFYDAPYLPHDTTHPVTFVSWDDALAFASRLGLTLPSEAQWEYACRAGTSTAYSFGDDPAEGEFFGAALAAELEALIDPGSPPTMAVDTLAPNAFGFFHVHGNVFEWCYDTQRTEFYSTPMSRRRNPICRSPNDNWDVRVLRGGGFRSPEDECRSATRIPAIPRSRADDVGFRCARPLFERSIESVSLDDLESRVGRLVDPRRGAENKIPELRTWLRDAEAVAERLPLLREYVEQQSRSKDAVSGRRLPRLRELLARLEAFADPFEGLKVRMELLFETAVHADEIWRHALDAIRVDYDGLRIEPQFGLVPDRRDPSTGLWTFLHYHGVMIPPRDRRGRLDTTKLGVKRESVLRFVLLPGGTFRPGPRDLAGAPVELEPFFMGQFEIDRETWRSITGYLKDTAPGGRPGDPALDLSGQDALAFCRLTGLRLPTAAQWEYACRAGTSTRYNTGDRLLRDQAVFFPCDADPAERVGTLETVGALPPNRFGLYGMHGGAGEWCIQSEGRPNVYRLGATTWYLAGGSWLSCVEDCTSSSRFEALPGHAGLANGMRVVRAVIPGGRD